MSGDRHHRKTKRFDSSKLAALTSKPDDDAAPTVAQATPAAPIVPTAPAAPTAESGPRLPRTETLPDPLTTQLLAEVARRFADD